MHVYVCVCHSEMDTLCLPLLHLTFEMISLPSLGLTHLARLVSELWVVTYLHLCRADVTETPWHAQLLHGCEDLNSGHEAFTEVFYH